MSKTRRNHRLAFKGKVALEVSKGEMTMAEIAAKHGADPTRVNGWKRLQVEGACGVLSKGGGRAEKQNYGDSLRFSLVCQHQFQKNPNVSRLSQPC
ncbi:MAG: hypothetical protein P4M00_05900 [Azospirillaceae bacterium]|nr:hypothetical protein [Azospirillaceae bacterium]